MEKSFFQGNGPFFIFGVLLIAILPGCLPISKQLRAEADKTLTFPQVFQNPDAYKGKIVIWGGEVVEAINQKDGTTLIVVLQRPLDWTEEPTFKRSEEDSSSLLRGMLTRMSSEEEGESLLRVKSREGKSCALANWNIPTLFF